MIYAQAVQDVILQVARAAFDVMLAQESLRLVLAQKDAIAEPHGASVHVHSVPGQGSSFTILFPTPR